MDEYKTFISLRLRESGYPDTPGFANTVNRLASLQGEAKIMLDGWLRNDEKVCFPEIEGINADYLRKHLEMKEPAIIISYAMLKADPIANSEYFKNLATKRNIFKQNKQL